MIFLDEKNFYLVFPEVIFNYCIPSSNKAEYQSVKFKKYIFSIKYSGLKFRSIYAKRIIADPEDNSKNLEEVKNFSTLATQLHLV